MKLALLVANRGFFPSSVIEDAYTDMRVAAQKAGVELLEIEKDRVKFGAVETMQEGMIFHDFLEEHHGEYDGVILSLPNFGDENGIKAALRDIRVPLLLQAYPDEIGKMDFSNRRDAFCGKLGLCAVFKQMGMKFTSGKPFVMHPLSDAFSRELRGFVSICRVVKKMRHMRLGVFGARTTAFKSVRFDEAALERLGCDTESIDMSMVFDKFDTIDPNGEAARRFLDRLEAAGDYCDTPGYAKRNLAILGATFTAFIEELSWMRLRYAAGASFSTNIKSRPALFWGSSTPWAFPRPVRQTHPTRWQWWRYPRPLTFRRVASTSTTIMARTWTKQSSSIAARFRWN
jgi:L-fucose isomerase-like protein